MLEDARDRRCATSSGWRSRLGFGPRFLHSTGQLHKGGPPAIVCVQVLGRRRRRDPDPRARRSASAQLMAAQAAGDLKVLRDRGRTAGRVDLAELLEVAR